MLLDRCAVRPKLDSSIFSSIKSKESDLCLSLQKEIMHLESLINDTSFQLTVKEGLVKKKIQEVKYLRDREEEKEAERVIMVREMRQLRARDLNKNLGESARKYVDAVISRDEEITSLKKEISDLHQILKFQESPNIPILSPTWSKAQEDEAFIDCKKLSREI